MRATWRSARLVPVAAAVWAAAAAATCLPDSTAAVSAACALVGTMLLALPAGRRRAGVVIVALVLAAAAAASAGLAHPARTEAARTAGTGRTVVVEATVTGQPHGGAEGGTTADARTSLIRAGVHETAVDSPVTIWASPDVDWPDDADPGATVRVRARAVPTDPGRRAVMLLRAEEVVVTAASTGPLELAAGLRAALSRSVEGLPEPGAGLVPGLAVGDTSGVSADLDAAMTASSLTHLTAVSGANCAIVVGAAFALAACCGAGRGLRVIVGVGVLAGFVVLVTPEPSVVRAAVMAGVSMLALLLGRVSAGVSVLSLAVAACLIADPWLSTSLGFALSSAATGALLVLARPLAHGLERVLPRPIAFAVSVPLSAELVCSPLIVLTDPSVSVWGIPANLLAGIAAPAATVIGLSACLAAPVPLVQSGLSTIAWVPAAWISGVATTVADLPAPRAPWLAGLAGVVALAVVCAAVGTLIAARRARVLRTIAAMVVTTTLGVAVGAALLQGVAAPWTRPAGGPITVCDVGQGDALLLRSGGRTALVDTGDDQARLTRCLLTAAVDRVDLLVLTHFDVDHVGAVDAVVGRVGEVLHGPVPDRAAQHRLDRLAGGGARLTEVRAGDRGALGSASWRVVWPESRRTEPGNDASVVIDIRGADMPATLLLGDLGAEAQARVRRSPLLGNGYAVVKVAHHGSADQDAELYRAIHAPVSLVSAGAGNRYGHPRASALALLRDSRVVRTDTGGTGGVLWRGGHISVWQDRAP